MKEDEIKKAVRDGYARTVSQAGFPAAVQPTRQRA
jgi:hypothetical protein